MLCLLLFHGNKSHTNAPQYYVMCTFPVLLFEIFAEMRFFCKYVVNYNGQLLKICVALRVKCPLVLFGFNRNFLLPNVSETA